MQHAELDDIRLAFDTAGDAGSPVLLIMGYGVPGKAWVHQIPELSEHHRVIWYDHRGCGATVAAPGAYTMHRLATDARNLLDHLGHERAHIVGVSMGGMVTQHLALEYPERVQTLTLVATHAGGGLRNKFPPTRGLVRFLQANTGLTRRKRLHHLERLLFPDPFLDACDRKWLEEVLLRDFGEEIPLKFRLSQMAAVMRHDTRDRLHALGRFPTLVVRPDLDILVDPAENDRLARLIPGARLVSFPEAGHGIVRQSHVELNALLLQHFGAYDPPR
jgi:pimeloyl-ACP methyl ester carboxylesterase